MPSEVPACREKHENSVKRAIDWLCKVQGRDNSFGIPYEEGVNPLMVTALAYLWAGKPRRALGVLDRIRCFIREDDSLDRPKAKSRLSDQLQEPYALSWLVRSAAACGAFDIVHKCASHLPHFQHASSGGLFGTNQAAQKDEGVIELTTTGVAGLAFTAAGMRNQALSVGKFVLNWLKCQPDPQQRLFCQWHTRKGLLDEETGCQKLVHVNAPLLVSHSKPYTSYWMCGILISLLVELYQISGERKFLEAANSLFDFAEKSPELGRVCTSHKLAWAAAKLFSVSQDYRHIKAACLIADRLLEAQRDEGFFVYEDYCANEAELSQAAKVDVTSQFTAWTCAMLMRLPASEDD